MFIFLLDVSQHLHKITNLCKFGSNGHQVCKRIMTEKHPCCMTLCVFRCLIIGFRWIFLLIRMRNYLFLNEYFTSEGAVSHNVLCYQQLVSPNKLLCLQLFWVITNSVHAFKCFTISEKHPFCFGSTFVFRFWVHRESCWITW